MADINNVTLYKEGWTDNETFQDLALLARTGLGTISCLVAIFGVFANFVNVIVFRCQGFQETVNISLLALAVSDLLSLVSILYYNILVLCEWKEVSLLPRQFSYPSGWPIYTLAFCSCWIAVFISVERCLCVALPFTVKDIITPKVTVICLVLISSLGLGSVLPAFCSVKLSVFVTPENRTYIGIDFTEDRIILESITYVSMTSLQIGSFICLLISTFILILVLRRKAQRRLTKLTAVTSPIKGRRTGSLNILSKEDRVVKMVIVVSSIILVSFTLGQALSLLTIFRPQFDFGKEEEWLYHVLWTFAFFFFTVNASVNMVIYYRMSSKFRSTLLEIVHNTFGRFSSDPFEK